MAFHILFIGLALTLVKNEESLALLKQDPTIKQLLVAAKSKIKSEFSEFFESEKRERTTVITSIEEELMETRPSERQRVSKEKISGAA